MSPGSILRAGAEAAEREAMARAEEGHTEAAMRHKRVARLLCAVLEYRAANEITAAAVDVAKSYLTLNDRRSS